MAPRAGRNALPRLDATRVSISADRLGLEADRALDLEPLGRWRVGRDLVLAEEPADGGDDALLDEAVARFL